MKRPNKLLSMIILFILAESILVAELRKDLYLGVSSAEVLKEKITSYNLGYSLNSYYDNSLYWGVNFDFAISKLVDENIFSYGSSLNLGYTPVNDLSIYIIGSAMLQNIGNSSGAGFGYGFGSEYIINEVFSIDIVYKTHRIVADKITNYDYDLLGINIKYSF